MKYLVSGLLNTETTTAVRGFPVEYYPIDYPFFGIDTAVSGVAYNIAKALRTLGDDVHLASMTGIDFSAAFIRDALEELEISQEYVVKTLKQTPSSVVLYDPNGKRQIYCDLKDIQEKSYPFTPQMVEDADLVVACNINFNRSLLRLAKAAGKCIATDVHVLSDIHDAYNREFMECAQLLFLSDEGIAGDYRQFLRGLADNYDCRVIVLGRGSKGAAMYLRETGEITDMPAVSLGPVVNTVGAGDALFSGFIHYYARGHHPVEALRRAQVFAAYKIMENGASNGFVTEQVLEQWLREH